MTEAVQFDEELRRIFASLADALLADVAGLPSPSAIDVQHEWLDRVMRARPDLAGPLRTILERAAGRDPLEEARRLGQEDTRSFVVLANAVAGAYYMHPDVRAAIRYPGQTPRLSDQEAADDVVIDQLLRPVRERGPIYRR